MGLDQTVSVGSSSWRPDFIGKNAAELGDYLDRVSRSQALRLVAESALGMMVLREGYRVLEVGCGNGVFLSRLAKAVGASGHVCGIDHSPAFVAQAQARMISVGLDAAVTVQEADAYELPFAAGSFDAAHCERVLMHLGDPSKGLAEMKRVVRPGGSSPRNPTGLGFGSIASIGSAVARESAAEGAEVFLSGRHKANLDALAAQIVKDGRRAQAAVVDCSDSAAVNAYLAAIPGSVDLVYNAIGSRAHEYGNGKLAVELAIEQYMVAVDTIVKASFVTAQAGARRMSRQGSGVIVFVTGSPARAHVRTTAIGTAFGAIECLAENLAWELGRAGVRVVCLRTTPTSIRARSEKRSR